MMLLHGWLSCMHIQSLGRPAWGWSPAKGWQPVSHSVHVSPPPPPPQVRSWSGLDLPQLEASAQSAISSTQFRPRRGTFIKSDLAFPQLAGLLIPDSKCQLVTVCLHASRSLHL